jgi:hypothetical protein
MNGTPEFIESMEARRPNPHEKEASAATFFENLLPAAPSVLKPAC